MSDNKISKIKKLLKQYGVEKRTKDELSEIKEEKIKKAQLVEQEKQEKTELLLLAEKATELRESEERQRVLDEEFERREKISSAQYKLTNPFSIGRKFDTDNVRKKAVDNVLPKAFIPEQTSYPEPFEEEPALNRELAAFKKKINEHLYKMGFASSGGGGIGDIADAGDMDTATAKVDGKFLRYSSSDAKWIGSDPTDISHAITALDIDGATDIGAAIVDADLFIIDDGAGGTNRKVTASRIKTYVEDAAGEVPLANLDIDGGTDIGAAIVDADLFIIDDGAGGTNRKTVASRIKTYIAGTSSSRITDMWIGDDIIMDSDSAAIQFGDDQEIALTHLHNQGLEITSTHDAPLVRRGEDVFIVLNGTNSSSANAGDNIIDETDSDDIIGEDQVFLHTGMQRDVINIMGSDGKIKKSIAGFSAGAI